MCINPKSSTILKKLTSPQKGTRKLQFSAMGHELAQVSLAQSLTYKNDASPTYYRSRPFMLACMFPLKKALTGNLPLSGGASESLTYFDAPIKHIATPDIPIPYNVEMMESLLPNVDKIIQKINQLLDY